MTKYTVGFEGTVNEEYARQLLDGYCTILKFFTDFGTLIAKVETDNPSRLELRLESLGAVDQYMAGGE